MGYVYSARTVVYIHCTLPLFCVKKISLHISLTGKIVPVGNNIYMYKLHQFIWCDRLGEDSSERNCYW